MATASQTAAATPGRGLNIALWILQILLGALFVFAGTGKLLALQPEVVENFQKIGLGNWFRYLTGVLETAGGIGLFIPPLAGLAALGLAGVMVGAALTHVLVLKGDLAGEPVLLRLKRIPADKVTLTSIPFRWINDYPDNR